MIVQAWIPPEQDSALFAEGRKPPHTAVFQK